MVFDFASADISADLPHRLSTPSQPQDLATMKARDKVRSRMLVSMRPPDIKGEETEG